MEIIFSLAVGVIAGFFIGRVTAKARKRGGGGFEDPTSRSDEH